VDHQQQHPQVKGQKMNARIESALSFIPSEDRDTWVTMAMAVKSELGESGFDMWDAWSATSDKYNPHAARSVWRSCRGSGVTIGTLFHEARGYGWIDNEKPAKATYEQIQARKAEALARQTAEGIERQREADQAAKKAGWIMHQARPEKHAYLHLKGWPEAKGAVWMADETTNLLCVPMRVNEKLVGVQLIDREGQKKFLRGQVTSGAEFVISNLGHGCSEWYVEGYATGLSLRDCLHALRMRYRIHVAFSASNLVKVAQRYGPGYVVADNDESQTGERAAIATGLPYYLPLKGDLNDLCREIGVFKSAQLLHKFLREAKK